MAGTSTTSISVCSPSICPGRSSGPTRKTAFSHHRAPLPSSRRCSIASRSSTRDTKFPGSSAWRPTGSGSPLSQDALRERDREKHRTSPEFRERGEPVRHQETEPPSGVFHAGWSGLSSQAWPIPGVGTGVSASSERRSTTTPRFGKRPAPPEYGTIFCYGNAGTGLLPKIVGNILL